MFMDAADKLGGGFVRSEKPAAEGGVILYITVDEIDAMLPTIEKHGGTRAKGKTLVAESVGWWASFRDPAGNVIGLYQKVPRA